MSSNDVDFKSLYQSSLKLTTAIDDFGIPRLEKSLEQLDDASRSFFYQQQQTPPASSSSQSAASAATPSLSTLKKKRPASTSAKGAVDKANFLLAAKGIDAEKLSKELQAFELTPGFEPETPLGETDIEGYLTHHHEMIILTAIEEVNRRTMEATHDRMNQAMIDDFELAKQQLLEDLGSAKQLGVRNYPRIVDQIHERNVFARRDHGQQAAHGLGLTGATFNGQPRFDLSQSGSFFAPSINGTTGAALNLSQLGVDSQMNDEMKQYGSVIRDLNAYRVPGTRSQFDLAGNFQRVCGDNVSTSTVGAKWEAVLKCWQVLGNMLAGGDLKTRTQLVSEREFGDLDEQDEPQRVLVEQRFAHGACVFLETQFKSFVQQTVQKNHLPIGGVPDLVSSIRAFVKYLQSSSLQGTALSLRASNNEVDIWALLYYCLRCGGDQDAIELATSYMRAGGNSPVDENVLCGLRYRAHQKRSFTDRSSAPLSAFAKQFPTEYTHLVDRYHRLSSVSIDAVAVVNPYERCVVNFLCFGNANASEPRILTTIEDYLWQRLNFIQRVARNSSAPDSAYSIARLAKSIHKFGPAHFEGASKAGGGNSAYAPFLYFEILLIAQQFEAAVKYIGSRGFLLEATHFALALNYYGLLRCSVGEEDDRTVDLVRLVRQYIHGFQRTNPTEAAEYIACIPDIQAKKELFSELLLETRKFDTLAGFTNNTDGSRTRGVLDRLLKDVADEEIRDLILSAARKAEARGRPHDAYALLKCAGDVEGVIALLNTQLATMLSAPRAEREEWFRVAKEFAEKWMRFPWVQSLANKYARTAAVAFQTLLNLNIFLELYERQQSEDAIRFVDELEVIPTPQANNLAVCVDRFLAFDETVRQNFHVLLLGYVECLVRDTERMKVQTTGEVRRVGIQTLREKAELVVTFAGMIKFRLPPGTNERLNRMEAMIY